MPKFKPQVVLSELFTMELARLTKTACGLRWCCVNPCGVPMVLAPRDRNQPGVAAPAAALGVAEVVARRGLTEQRLSAAIDQALGNPHYQEHAACIAIASRLQT